MVPFVATGKNKGGKLQGCQDQGLQFWHVNWR